MRCNGLGQRQVGSQKERRPVDAVLPGNLLAHDVDVGRPVFFELLLLGWLVAAIADCGHIIREGVEPDINNVLLLRLGGGRFRNRNSPREAGARHREIAEIAGNVRVPEF